VACGLQSLTDLSISEWIHVTIQVSFQPLVDKFVSTKHRKGHRHWLSLPISRRYVSLGNTRRNLNYSSLARKR